ncbi:TorD/DmsD family molecular chaperone [Helicobacter pametensis]|uniref:TorD/DmsD family molecular chaperone n=1 Tax=Helicobacter pametensis TaxID=95149 RepID=UPI000484356C|nr:molecular chaperone TorD family protein [Helicobacter pametensis]
MDPKTFNPSRILYYDFFSNLFIYELLINKKDILLQQIDILSKAPLCDLKLYQTIQTNLYQNFTHLQEEYTKLFALPFKTSISLYLSHYQNGYLGGNPLLQVKALLKESGFFLDRSITKENEDHFGILCLFMKFLLLKENKEQSNQVFEECIKPLGPHITNALSLQNQSPTYHAVGKILEEFMAFELELQHALT